MTEAHAAAIAVAKKNYPDASWTEDTTRWRVKCDPKLKVLLVQFANTGTTKSNFAPVFGGSGTVTTIQATGGVDNWSVAITSAGAAAPEPGSLALLATAAAVATLVPASRRAKKRALRGG